MRTVLVWVACLLLAVVCLVEARAADSADGVVTERSTPRAPANDNFADAKRIVGWNYHASADNTLATAEASEPLMPFAWHPNHSLWWTWTAPTNGMIAMNVRGSSVNTVLGVYEGDSLETLTLAYQACYYKIGELHFLARAGVTYRIMVDSYWEGSVGRVVLNLFRPRVPPNDDFANAKVLHGMHGAVTGNNRFAGPEPYEPTAGGLSSQWYSWTAPKSGVLTFRLRSGHEENPDRLYKFDAYTGNALTNLVYAAFLGWATGFPREWQMSVTEGITYRIMAQGIGDTVQPPDIPFHLSFRLAPN